MNTAPKGKVLIVDDDSVLRALVSGLLERHGYATREASNAREAFRLILRDDIDAALLDLSMPEAPGEQLLAQLRRLARPPAVIIVSAQTALETRVRSLYAGAADYLTKPFEPEELLARLAAVLRQRRELAQAREASLTDPLTGVGNRALFEEALAREFARAGRRKRPLALVYLDVDGLKALNDAYGHAAGDAVLRSLGALLREQGRRGDVAARIGGDEFALLLPETRRAEAARLVGRLKQALSKRTAAAGPGRSLPVRASMGFAVLGEDAVDAAGLRLAADRALYEAKALRRPSALRP